MPRHNRWSYVLCVIVCLFAVRVSALAQSELDPARKGNPPIIVQVLDPKSDTVTSYRAFIIDENLKPSNIAALPPEERDAAIKKFLDGVTIVDNKIDVVKAERTKMASELDTESSTPAWGWRFGWGGYRGWGGWRWGGWGGYGGWYGRGFYGGYSGYGTSYYYPYWGYSGYSGYYSYPYYSYYSYYPSYYGYSYYPSYGYSYYPYYTTYGCSCY